MYRPEALIRSRKDLLAGLGQAAKVEAEGGCGVIGTASSVPITGRHFFQPLYQMKNRGNGKGGGVAVVGLSAEQLGVSQRILNEDYIIQVAFLDESVRDSLEQDFIRSFLEVHHEEPVPSVDDFREVPGLTVRPPEVRRYFCRVEDEILESFARKHGLEDLPRETVEHEYIYQNCFKINKKYYSSLGDKKAFVLSQGKNMLVFKIVGWGDQVIRYYKLEDLEAHVWIGHHRYPTKGKVWHPGGAHPFTWLNGALVHNGDFANYHSIVEYLRQRNRAPLFLTDTEVAALLYDTWERDYRYPAEYIIEAMAPTTERDFELLPDEKKRLYRAIQTSHIHGSPDGPWFFIVALNDTRSKLYQLIGITDTSMLRPQVFALQENGVKIGVIASEKQAIDALLRSLSESDRRFCRVADKYWNARGGSHTDGGAFIYSITYGGEKPDLVCTDKFGRIVRLPSHQRHFAMEPHFAKKSISAPASANNALADLSYGHVLGKLKRSDFEDLPWFCDEMLRLSKKDNSYTITAIDVLTELLDRNYDTGTKRKSCVRALLDRTSEDLFDSIPGDGSFVRFDWERRMRLLSPMVGDQRLLVDAADFPREGNESAALFLGKAHRLGWRNVIAYKLRGHRFIGNGLGPRSNGLRIDVYGESGDYLGSGLDGAEIYVHNNAQDQVAQIMKSGKLVIHGDVGQTFMYASKGGEVYVLGNAAGRPMINAVGSPRVVINGTALDYLAESFMAGDPLNGGGFVILNGVRFDERGNILEMDTPYPGGNLFSLASGGAIYLRDPNDVIDEEQLHGGRFNSLTDADWNLILPYLRENERLFHVSVDELVGNRPPEKVYRKVEPVKLEALSPYGL